MDFFNTMLASFTAFFATVGPVEAAVLFASFTTGMERAERRRVAITAVVIASGILLFFTLAGHFVLEQLGVSIAAFKTAGGAILGLIGLDMIFSRPEQGSKLTPKEGQEALAKDDLAVFPMATPLLAGPGAMSACILLAVRAHGDVLGLSGVLAGLALVMVLTLVLLFVAQELSRILGVTAQRVLARIFGILLAAIAVQAIFDGLKESGLIAKAVTG